MYPTNGELECKRCNTRLVLDGSKEVIIEKKAVESKGRLVIEEDAQTLPTEDAECSQCGNKKAYWVLRQMRAGDEAETRIFRCTKCGNTWRED
jgi:DNA-directed RNA polymerase subunit M